MKILFVANWKANPATLKDALRLFSSIKNTKKKNQEIIICAPAVFVGFFKGGSIKLGAQDVSDIANGPYTGEITASMLKSAGVSYCIVGHSERRKKGETSANVAEKIKQLLKAKITPILCVGEKARGHDGEHFKEITEMLLSSIATIPKNHLSNIILAYEPLWAISTEKKGSMEPETIHETVLFLKKVLNDALGKKISSKIRIIYGGSVDQKNAREIVEKGKAAGFLVGKATLNPRSFKAISGAVSKNPSQNK